jgi:NodT family efflux transporter outer membrane factor (OMF) lipoprotein
VPAFAGDVGTVEAPDAWWTVFSSSELNELVNTAFSGNLALSQAVSRLRQAQERAVKAGAGLAPSVDTQAGAGASRRRFEQTGGARTTQTSEDYSLGLAASYELDLWGRVRATRESALLDERATREDLQAVGVLLAGEIADRWLQLVEQRAQLIVLKEQLEANRTTLELLKLRQLNSRASALDVYQQRQIVAGTESLVPQAEERIQLLLHQIAVLIGRPPEVELGLEAEQLPELPELPDPGVPAELLAQRPDISAALLRLEATGWDTAAARADRLPAIRLTGSGAYGAEDFGEIFDNWAMNLAANLAGPLMDGGRRRAEVRRILALRDERLGRYRELVLTALKEVEDALVRERKGREYLVALRRERDFAGSALEEAQKRFRNGANDYLPVLAALTSLQRLQREILTAERSLLSNRTALYRAMGGRWLDDSGNFLLASGRASDETVSAGE